MSVVLKVKRTVRRGGKGDSKNNFFFHSVWKRPFALPQVHEKKTQIKIIFEVVKKSDNKRGYEKKGMKKRTCYS